MACDKNKSEKPTRAMPNLKKDAGAESRRPAMPNLKKINKK